MLKKQNKTKFKIIVALICIATLLIFGVIQIFALFKSRIDGDIILKNGAWNIFVNDKDISTGGIDKKFTVNNIEISSNSHVKDGNIAPGLSAHFNIKIDPKDTDVSIRYSIMIDQEKITNKNIIISQVKETEHNNKLTQVEPGKYVGIMTLDDIKNNNTNTINIEVKWVDNDENSEQDIKLGTKEAPKIEIPITVHVEQFI